MLVGVIQGLMADVWLGRVRRRLPRPYLVANVISSWMRVRRRLFLTKVL